MKDKWIANKHIKYMQHHYSLGIYHLNPQLAWLVWLSGLSTGVQTKGSLVRFPVRAHAWVAGQVCSRGHARGNHTLMFLSLSFSLPSPVSKNKSNLKKKLSPQWDTTINLAVWFHSKTASLLVGLYNDSHVCSANMLEFSKTLYIGPSPCLLYTDLLSCLS